MRAPSFHRSLTVILLVLLAFVARPGPGDAQGPVAPSAAGGDVTTPTPADPDEVHDALARSASDSTSIGGPNAGRLVGALALPLRGPGFRYDPTRSPVGRFGNVEMVQSLIRAAGRVHTELPGSQLTVGEISLQSGGPIAGHGSHQGGRDVDVLFYYTDESGSPVPAVEAFVDRQGRAMDFGDLARSGDERALLFDAPRSWRFVEAMLSDPAIRVQRIFLAEHVRTLLLRHARSVGAPRAAVRRFADITCQPSHPHDDHFHIRLFCSAEDLRGGCLDGRPMYPWRRRELRAEGLRPSFAGPERHRAPLTTLAESTEEALARDDLEPTLRAWLQRRESWRPRPHPGRRWCR